MQRTHKAPKKNSNVKVIVMVSLFWVVLAATVIGYIQNGQAQYNKGVFDGMSKTKAILQAK